METDAVKIDVMEPTAMKERIQNCPQIVVGLGEEWKCRPEADAAKREALKQAYESLYRMLKDKDYFIITMATDGLIYETSLGSTAEEVASVRRQETEVLSCAAMDEKTMALMDQIFPVKEEAADSRWQRIVAPCGNETWRQCSRTCTKDIWEAGEVEDDICPHCGAPLTGNTVDAKEYIEEGYLPQWNRYTRWMADAMNREVVLLELGVGFSNPGLVRFPFEKIMFFNKKAFLCRVHGTFPQITEELNGRAEGIRQCSTDWVAGW